MALTTAPPPLQSSAEVKEKVELYLYSQCGPSWPLIRRPLPSLVILSHVVNCTLLSVYKCAHMTRTSKLLLLRHDLAHATGLLKFQCDASYRFMLLMCFKTNDVCVETTADFAVFCHYLAFLQTLMAESKFNSRKAEIKNGKNI